MSNPEPLRLSHRPVGLAGPAAKPPPLLGRPGLRAEQRSGQGGGMGRSPPGRRSPMGVGGHFTACPGIMLTPAELLSSRRGEELRARGADTGPGQRPPLAS